jgi:hypothetical protein
VYRLSPNKRINFPHPDSPAFDGSELVNMDGQCFATEKERIKNSEYHPSEI